MKYEVDQEGTIAVPLSVNQALFIKKLLVSNHFQSRKERAPSAYFDEVIPIMVAVDDAINAKNKAKSDPARNLKPVMISSAQKRVAKTGFRESVRNFFDPPYSISDFETAVTLSGQKHNIIHMDFPEAGRSHPCNIVGQIFFIGAWYNARWNSHGHCECDDLHPEDVRGFHLVRFGHNDTSSPAFTLFLIVIVVLIVFLIASLFI